MNFVTADSAYQVVIKSLLGVPINASPRGFDTREIRNAYFSVANPHPHPITTCDAELNKKISKYTEAEFKLHERGCRSADEFAAYAPFWNNVANKDRTINSAYGYLIWFNRGYDGLTPWMFAKAQLERDIETRQAVLAFQLPEHRTLTTKDLVCTMHGWFSIRDNRLNFDIVMRSNDAILGLVYDMPWFISLMWKMRAALATTYPDLVVGTYSHYVHSLHLYDRDVERACKIVGIDYNGYKAASNETKEMGRTQLPKTAEIPPSSWSAGGGG